MRNVTNLAKLLRIHTNHAKVHRGQLILVIFGHRSEAILRNYISHPSREQLRTCLYILSDALSGKATSVTAAEFYGAVIPSNLLFLSFIH